MKVLRMSFTALAISALILPAAPSFAANRQNPPVASNSTIQAEVGAPVSYWDVDHYVPQDVEGAAALLVDQGTSESIVMADIVFPSGVDLTGGDYSIVAGTDTTCDTSNLVVDFSGNEVTAHGFSCWAGSSHEVRFTFEVDNLVGTSTITTVDDYTLTSQFRTNLNRKNKYQSWIVAGPGVFTVWEPV